MGAIPQSQLKPMKELKGFLVMSVGLSYSHVAIVKVGQRLEIKSKLLYAFQQMLAPDGVGASRYTIIIYRRGYSPCEVTC